MSFSLGGRTSFAGNNVDTIIEFETETETWSEVGRMKVARNHPGVSIVNLDDVLEYATDCLTTTAGSTTTGPTTAVQTTAVPTTSSAAITTTPLRRMRRKIVGVNTLRKGFIKIA